MYRRLTLQRHFQQKDPGFPGAAKPEPNGREPDSGRSRSVKRDHLSLRTKAMTTDYTDFTDSGMGFAPPCPVFRFLASQGADA
jgi:hypothetical protein